MKNNFASFGKQKYEKYLIFQYSPSIPMSLFYPPPSTLSDSILHPNK